jgi:hypothetical protein
MPSGDQESYACNNEMFGREPDHHERIRQLNDRFRKSFRGGRVMLTCGVQALGNDALRHVLAAVQQHDQFGTDNDPYNEHDFGSCTWGCHRFFWKIDYYDARLEFGSPDPSDPNVTSRVLTIMLASEY